MSKRGATPREPSNGMATFAKILVGFLLFILLGLFVYLWNPFHKATPTVTEIPKIQPKTTQGEQPEYEFYELLPEQQVTGVPTKPLASQTAITARPDAVVTGKNQANPINQATATAETSTDKKPVDNSDDAEMSDTANNVSNAQNPIMTDAPQETPTGNAKENPMLGKSRLEAQTSKKAVIVDASPDKTYILQINSFDNADDADRRRAEVLMAGVDAQIVKKRLADDTIVYQVISRQMPSSQMAGEAQRRLQNNGIDSLIVEQRRK